FGERIIGHGGSSVDIPLSNLSPTPLRPSFDRVDLTKVICAVLGHPHVANSADAVYGQWVLSNETDHSFRVEAAPVRSLAELLIEDLCYLGVAHLASFPGD